MSRRVVVEADGGSRGNPGPAGYGAVVRDADSGAVLAERAAAIGRETNNVAEYRGLIAGLEAARDLGASEVDVRLDSKLLVEQMSGRWKIKHPALQDLARQAMALARSLPAVRFSWVPRARNTHADRLANEAMDAAAAGRSWSASTGPQDSPAAEQPVASPRRETGWRDPDAEAPTTTVLLRHGETELSPRHAFSGRGDVPLSDRGAAQAAAVARALARRADIAAVVSSPLRRAVQTAEVVAAALGLPVTVDEDLVETDFGDWEGYTYAEIRERWPIELGKWSSAPDVAPPGGESFAETATRVRRARDRLLATYGGRTVVVVSHVTPIKLLVRAAVDAPIAAVYRMYLDIASVSEVDWHTDGAAVLRRFNDSCHLIGVAE